MVNGQRIAVVVPAYHAEKTLEKSVRKSLQTLLLLEISRDFVPCRKVTHQYSSQIVQC
jgi:hypothetical protein